MSRGLGRVERFILSWLAADEKHEWDLAALSQAMAGHVDCPRCAHLGFRWGEVSAATYKAVARAASSLERKGLVRCRHERARYYAPRGEPTRWKECRLNVETVAILPWIQRLPCAEEEWERREAAEDAESAA